MKRVFEIFEQILKIPHESGNEKLIAEYIGNFAKEHGLEYNIDEYFNVFIRKNNNSRNTIILQAHSDMVCVSKLNDFDFKNNAIPFFIDGDFYKSQNTSLGADDGIGVAIILAMLEEENMPNIEAIITTQEETTMAGASNFDYSRITGKTLVSLDGIKEGDIESSSAGMCSITLNKKVNFIDNNENLYRIRVEGLAGGHSGDDIHKNRKNAIKILDKVLYSINNPYIVNISVGAKDNVIASNGFVEIKCTNNLEQINELIGNMNFCLDDEDKDMKIIVEQNDAKNKILIKESDEIIKFINEIEDGLLETFEDGFPLLSSNIGKIELINNKIEIKLSIRSSDVNKEKNQIDKLNKLCKKYNFKMNINSIKPFFPYKKESEIRNILSENYRRLYNKKAEIKKVHACMEGGIFSKNIDDLDICTIAPTIQNCHSINENVSISSTNRVYEWLKETLVQWNIK